MAEVLSITCKYLSHLPPFQNPREISIGTDNLEKALVVSVLHWNLQILGIERTKQASWRQCQ